MKKSGKSKICRKKKKQAWQTSMLSKRRDDTCQFRFKSSSFTSAWPHLSLLPKENKQCHQVLLLEKVRFASKKFY